MKKTNQAGFSAIEAVLVILVLAVISGAGYFIWHKKSDNNPLKDTTSNAVKVPNPASNTHNLTIPEWGVAGSYKGNPTLIYTGMGGENNNISFSSQSLEDQGNDCGYRVQRIKSTDHLIADSGFDEGVAEAYFSSDAAKQGQPFVKVGDYYYFHIPPQEGCFSKDGHASNALDSLQSGVFGESKQLLLSLKAN